jgi:hypothetical protein
VRDAPLALVVAQLDIASRTTQPHPQNRGGLSPHAYVLEACDKWCMGGSRCGNNAQQSLATGHAIRMSQDAMVSEAFSLPTA